MNGLLCATSRKLGLIARMEPSTFSLLNSNISPQQVAQMFTAKANSSTSAEVRRIYHLLQDTNLSRKERITLSTQQQRAMKEAIDAGEKALRADAHIISDLRWKRVSRIQLPNPEITQERKGVRSGFRKRCTIPTARNTKASLIPFLYYPSCKSRRLSAQSSPSCESRRLSAQSRTVGVKHRYRGSLVVAGYSKDSPNSAVPCSFTYEFRATTARLPQGNEVVCSNPRRPKLFLGPHVLQPGS